MRIRKIKKVLYINSNIFFPPYCTLVFTPVLRFSPPYHPYVSFPLHPAFTPSLLEPKRNGVRGEWRVLHDEKFYDLYFSPNVILVKK